jgi:hypothetical protein
VNEAARNTAVDCREKPLPGSGGPIVMRTIAAALIAVCFASAGIVVGRTALQFPNLAVGSQGFSKCGTWRDDADNPTAGSEQVAWTLGFVSGFAFSGESVRQVSDSDVRAWMTDYCRKNPERTIADGARALINRLKTGPLWWRAAPSQ